MCSPFTKQYQNNTPACQRNTAIPNAKYDRGRNMFFPEPKQYIEQENLLLVDESKNLKSSKPLILAK